MDQILVIGAIGVVGVCLVIIFGAIYKRRQDLKFLQSQFDDVANFDFNHEAMESVTCYYDYTKEASDLDQTTWHDLDMDKVYNRINQSMSSIGDSYLYSYIRKQDDVDHDFVTKTSLRLKEDISFRTQVQKAFVSVGRVFDNGLEVQLFEGKESVPQQLKMIRYQAILAYVPFIAFFINPALGFGLLLIVFTINLLTYTSLNKEIVKRIRALNYFISIIKCARILEKNTDIKVKGLDKFKGVRSYLKIVNMAMVDATGIAQLMSVINAYFCFYALSFMKITNAMKDNPEEAHDVFEFLGLIELAYSRASIMNNTPTCVPEFTEDLGPKVEGINHPLLRNPVSNTINLDKNMLVTGSNASGKSTFVRSVAVNVILGQRLNLCFAEAMSFKKCHVLTSMAISDDVSSGDSYFVAEIKSIKRLIDAVDSYDYCLLVIDEILKGTNTIERISASSAILEYLKDKPAFVCAATHDIELVEILGEAYSNVHFREKISDEGIGFDYLIQPGPSNTRNAIKLLDYYNYDSKIIAKANAMADAFTNSRSWPHI